MAVHLAAHQLQVPRKGLTPPLCSSTAVAIVPGLPTPSSSFHYLPHQCGLQVWGGLWLSTLGNWRPWVAFVSLQCRGSFLLCGRDWYPSRTTLYITSTHAGGLWGAVGPCIRPRGALGVHVGCQGLCKAVVLGGRDFALHWRTTWCKVGEERLCSKLRAMWYVGGEGDSHGVACDSHNRQPRGVWPACLWSPATWKLDSPDLDYWVNQLHIVEYKWLKRWAFYICSRGGGGQNCSN